MTNFVTNAGSGGSTFASDTIAAVEYPLAKSTWGVAGTATPTSLTNPIPIQPAATNFIFSALGVNSSTTQLAAAGTFTGTIESTQNQQTISILLTSDQPGTLHLIQYIDAAGTFKCNDFTEAIAANVPFSEAYTANGNYFKLTFINNGASTTTTLNINTAYGTLPAVSSQGNGLVSLNEVNGTAISLGQTTMVNSLPVTLASNQSALTTQGGGASGAAVTGNPNLIAGTFSTTLPTVTTGQAVTVQTTARGEQLVAISSGATAVAVKAASTAAVATDPALVVAISPNNSVGITGTGGVVATKASGTAAATTDIAQVVSLSPNSPIVLPTPSTSIINSAATTNATSIKASAGNLYSVTASNTGAAAAFVKLYNLATAPTVGTSTIAITISVPAGGSVNLPFGTSGARFSTGIGLSITNLAADTDTTAVVAAQVKVITSYI